MPRRSDGHDEGDDSQYDWLYGGSRSGRSGPSAHDPEVDDPEPTRMMPTMSRPGSSGAGASANDDTQVHRSLPRPEVRSEGRSGRRAAPAVLPSEQRRRQEEKSSRPRSTRTRRRRPLRIVLGLIALWVLFLLVVPFFAWSKVHQVNAFPSTGRPADQPGTTYLLVGSDSRRGLSAEQRKQLTTGNASGARTDTIMMLHTGAGPNVLVSIPRDSLVPIPGYGTTKINAAFAYGGPKLLVKTIEQDTGVRIDHYLEIGFGPFVNLVNAVGGIQICPSRRIKDKDSGLNVQKGCQQVDGIQGLAWARARHPFPTQDIARAQHQREVIGKIAGGIVSPWTFLNPFRYYAVMNAASQVTVDDQSSPFTVAALGMSMIGSTKRCTMPLADLAVHWDPTRARELMQLIKTDRTDQVTHRLCTKTGLP